MTPRPRPRRLHEEARCNVTTAGQATVRFALGLLLTTLGLALGGCSRNTTIRTQDGALQEVYLEGSDETSIRGIDERGRHIKIPRSSIRDVTHPGTAAMVVGAGILFLDGLIVYDTQTDQCDSYDPHDECVRVQLKDVWPGVALLAGIGVTVFTYGASARLTSMSRFEPEGPGRRPGRGAQSPLVSR